MDTRDYLRSMAFDSEIMRNAWLLDAYLSHKSIYGEFEFACIEKLKKIIIDLDIVNESKDIGE